MKCLSRVSIGVEVEARRVSCVLLVYVLSFWLFFHSHTGQPEGFRVRHDCREKPKSDRFLSFSPHPSALGTRTTRSVSTSRAR